MIDERVLTAFHEASHAVAALSNGQVVTEISILATPASSYAPGSLGHQCCRPYALPREDDLYAQSGWVQAYLQWCLAGYLMEDLLSERLDLEINLEGRRQPGSDHADLLGLLYQVGVRDPDEAGQYVRSARAKTQSLLLDVPGNLDLVEEVAVRLLEVDVMHQQEFQRCVRRVLKLHSLSDTGVCGAVHPTNRSTRCNDVPHPDGEHSNETWERVKWSVECTARVTWPGFKPTPRNQRVTAMTGTWKRVRGFVRNGPIRQVPKHWNVAFEACDEMPPSRHSL